MTSTPVVVLLACYNGEDFLSQQLESLRLQTYRDWRLLIRDDGSSDSTLAIIEDFCARDSRASLIRDDLGRLGASGNFNALLASAQKLHGGSLFFLCD